MATVNIGLRGWALVLLLLALAPLSITAPYVLLEPEQPDGTITFPASPVSYTHLTLPTIAGV